MITLFLQQQQFAQTCFILLVCRIALVGCSLLQFLRQQVLIVQQFSQKNWGSFVGILEDISWRKEAEESLRQSEERFLLAMQGSHDGLWDWDMVTDKVFYSRRYMQMLGMEAEEFNGNFSVFESRIHPEHHSLFSSPTLNPKPLRFSILTASSSLCLFALYQIRSHSQWIYLWPQNCSPRWHCVRLHCFCSFV